MKRICLLLTALVLALAMGTTAFAEEAGKNYAELHPEVRQFLSYWVSGDGTIRISAAAAEEAVEMVIIQMTGENTFTSWEYVLTYNAETNTLDADATGMKAENTFSEGGEITESVYAYDDGTAAFSLNEDGELCWEDDRESTFEATTFHRIGCFPGVYDCGGTHLWIRWAGEELIYDLGMDQRIDASRSWSWGLGGIYDPETDRLTVNGFRLLYTYKEDGTLDLDADQQDAEANAVFFFDEEGKLSCESKDDEIMNGLKFELNPTSPDMWMWEF